MNVDGTLWFFAAVLGFGVVNLLAATVLLRRRERAQPSPPALQGRSLTRPTLDVLALSLIAVVLMAAVMLVVQLVLPSAPAIGRAALAIIAVLITRAVGRIVALLPNTPRWLPRFIRSTEIALLALAVVGLLLAYVRPPA